MNVEHMSHVMEKLCTVIVQIVHKKTVVYAAEDF